MDSLRKLLALVLAGLLALPSGCFLQSDRKFNSVVPPDIYKQVASEIEYPAESACTQMNTDESLSSPRPWTIDTKGTPEYRDISLDEAIRIALQNSRVLRDLGGAVVRSPATTRTAMDPAATETDPRTGVEAALERVRCAVSHEHLLGEKRPGTEQRILRRRHAHFVARRRRVPSRDHEAGRNRHAVYDSA